MFSLSLEDPNVPLSLEQEPKLRISGAQGTTDVAIMRRGTVGSWQAFGQAKWHLDHLLRISIEGPETNK